VDAPSVERAAEGLRHPPAVEGRDQFQVEDAARLCVAGEQRVAATPARHELIEAERPGEVQLPEDRGERILAGPMVLPPSERGFGAAGVEAARESVGDALESGVILDESGDPLLDETGGGPLIAFNAGDGEGEDPPGAGMVKALAVDHANPQQHGTREARGLNGPPVLFGFPERLPPTTAGILNLPWNPRLDHLDLNAPHSRGPSFLGGTLLGTPSLHHIREGRQSS